MLLIFIKSFHLFIAEMITNCLLLVSNLIESLEDAGSSKTGQTIVISLSLICLALTIVVYILVDYLQNFLGKCFVSYMASLFMGFLFLLLDSWGLSQSFCLTAGFIGYFFVMAAFLWLSVISLYLWMFFGGNYQLINFRILPFTIYIWAVAVALTGITYFADQFIENKNVKPSVGAEGHCWIYTRGWSAVIYFFGPIQLITMFNTTMYIITLIRIKRVCEKVPNANININHVFLRLFFIMGVSWSLEIISYAVQDNPFWANIFEFVDYLNWSQGIILFVLFVLKRNTLQRLWKSVSCAKTEDDRISDEYLVIGDNNLKYIKAYPEIGEEFLTKTNNI